MPISRPLLVMLALVALSACVVADEPIADAVTEPPSLDAGGLDPDPDAGTLVDGGPTADDDAGASDDDAGSNDDDAGADDDDAGSDAGVSSLCDEIDCGNGACLDSAGAAQCVCPQNIVGAACDECALGFGGDSCSSCAQGYLPSEEAPEMCVPDPCDGVDCSSHGTCRSDDSGSTMCLCDLGFDGDSCDTCATGYDGAACDECDLGYEAFEDTCVLIGCGGADCGIHGECVGPDEAGGGECQCARGYDGDACELCTDSYVLVDGACVPDLCSEIECVNGDCVVDGSTPSCECNNGFIGDACDSCPVGYVVRPTANGPACRLWLPITDGVRAWFDGSPPHHRVSRNPDSSVMLWFSGIESPVAYVAPFGDNPAATYLEEERGLRFDGAQQRMSSYPNHFKDTSAYTAYFVVSWNPDAGHQFVWGTTDQSAQYGGNGPLGFAVEILANGDVRARHNGTFAPNAGDVVSADFYQDTGAPQLIRVQWGPLLNGHVLTISNGNESASVESTTGAFTLDTALNRVGRNVIEGQGLDGLLHEVILVDRVLGSSERTAVEDYLRVKWQLP